MKFSVGLCLVLVVLDGAISAGIPKKDGLKNDEDTYGALVDIDENIQQDQVDYYEDPDEDSAAEEPPADTGGSSDVKVVSKPQTFVQQIGEVIRLPCQSSSKDEPIRVWTRNSNTLVFQGHINIANKKNYKLLPNGALEIILEGVEDFGDYTCKLAVTEIDQPEVLHHVYQKQQPGIKGISAVDNKHVFDMGETLTLTCQATGYPKPRITWHKNNEWLGTEGETLTIQNLRPKHAGSYRCLADNDVGHPAHEHYEVYINHVPIINVEKYIVNSDHESDAEFVCDVKAYPIAVVNWQRDGQNIVSKEPKITLERRKNNERNVLIVKNINENDFGVYTCVATNALGHQSKNVSLVKTPVVRKFEKSPTNETIKDVILQWRVESKQPISSHEVQYRRKGESSWKTITPEVNGAENDVYLIKHALKNLEPGDYETRARSKNNHGWSEYSDVVPFQGVLAKHGSHHAKTKHAKKEQKTQDSPLDTPPAQQRTEESSSVVGESISSSSTISSSLVLLASLIFIHVRQ
ncbi:unnamed protein product [Ceutorhynchus assimilis]|uniref:Ig-like domain-containing protein n=1 Tax=Ceutorhynchus assimilis TaxID=467358 RepID=A0A9N9QL23_9CUCU|nr:unnamed protein product [Ceutorhynchus assimilis]